MAIEVELKYSTAVHVEPVVARATITTYLSLRTMEKMNPCIGVFQVE